ncbi:helix-turn-helix domain-containing protein, partial [Corallococcus aberystwythensis]
MAAPSSRCGGGERGAPGSGREGADEGEDAASGPGRVAQEDVRLGRVRLREVWRQAAALSSRQPRVPWRLDTLAARTGGSPSRLQHLFQAELGVTPRQLRTWQRLRDVRRRFAAGGSLTLAAHKAGFGASTSPGDPRPSPPEQSPRAPRFQPFRGQTLTLEKRGWPSMRKSPGHSPRRLRGATKPHDGARSWRGRVAGTQ